MRIKTFFIFFIGLTIISCGGDTPESYFGKTSLNVNRYFNFGKRDFSSMQQSKKQNMLVALLDDEIKYTESYVEHVETFLIPQVKDDIEKVKNLQSTEDTEALINASLEVYSFIQKSYEEDYLAIARMMDANENQDVIDVAIEKLHHEKGAILAEKKNQLQAVAQPYARENGIKGVFR